jgi:hypothetical protein
MGFNERGAGLVPHRMLLNDPAELARLGDSKGADFWRSRRPLHLTVLGRGYPVCLSGLLPHFSTSARVASISEASRAQGLGALFKALFDNGAFRLTRQGPTPLGVLSAFLGIAGHVSLHRSPRSCSRGYCAVQKRHEPKGRKALEAARHLAASRAADLITCRARVRRAR